MEWYSVDAAGNRILVNSTIPGALKAYRARASLPPSLHIGLSGSSIVVTYEGVLQSATNPAGPYTDIQGASKPYVVPVGPTVQFFRAHNP